MEVHFFYIGLFLFLLSICIAFLVRKYLVLYTTSLISCIDNMLAGKKEVMFDEENEFLTSKIQVKLRQLYDVLKKQREQSRKDKEQLEEIISDISHQAKTPMSNIKMYADILQKQELSQKRQNEFLDFIQFQVDKLDSFMSSMLEVSQMEMGTISVFPKRQPIMKLIEGAVCSIAVKAEKKGMDLCITCDETFTACYDLKWTTEALVNILDNAVKYTNEKGKIRISVLKLGFFMKIQVTDSGKGIAEENLTKYDNKLW